MQIDKGEIKLVNIYKNLTKNIYLMFKNFNKNELMLSFVKLITWMTKMYSVKKTKNNLKLEASWSIAFPRVGMLFESKQHRINKEHVPNLGIVSRLNLGFV